MDERAHEASLTELVGQLRATIAKQDGKIAALEERVEQATAMEEVIRRAHRSESPLPAMAMTPAPPPAKRDRSHLRVVKGAAFAAGLAGLWRLLWSSNSRRLATIASGLAIGGATVLTPAVHAAGSPPQPHTSFRPQRPAATAPGAPPPRRHHTSATAGTRHRTSHTSPPPVPSPSPAASSGPPVPVPTPSPPVPLPTPPPPPVAGCVHHPHPGCPTPPVDLSAPLPSLLEGRVTSARDWLIKTQRLRLHQLPTAA